MFVSNWVSLLTFGLTDSRATKELCSDQGLCDSQLVSRELDHNEPERKEAEKSDSNNRMS